MANVLGTLVIALQAQTSAFAKGMADARSMAFTTSGEIVASLKTIENQMGRLKFGSAGEWKKSAEIAGAAFAGIGIAAAAAALVIVKSTADQALELNKLSQTYGVSIEALTGLRVASQMTGVSMEAMAKGLGFLDKAAVAAVQGHKQQTLAFKQLGIAVKDLTDGKGGMKDQLPLLLMVADRFSKLKDGVLKTAEAKALMGRGGAEEIALMNRGAAAIQGYIDKAKEMGLVMTAQDVAAALRLHETLILLELKMDALKLQLANGVIPFLNRLAAAFGQVDSTGNTTAKSIGGEIANGFKILALTINECRAGMKELIVLFDLSKWSGLDEAIDKIEVDRARLEEALDPKKHPALAGQSILGPGSSMKWLNLKSNIQWPTQGGGENPPVLPIAGGASKAAAEQMKQMESLLKSMKADWGMTLAEEASFWEQMLVPAKKFRDNLRKVTDNINDILGKMREETRKLTEKILGTPEDQAAYVGAKYNNPNLAKLGLPTTGPVQVPMATFGEAGQMFNAEQQKNIQEELNKLEQDSTKFVSNLNEKMGENNSIISAILSPMETLARFQERLNSDYKSGTIDLNTKKRAMEEAIDSIKGMYDPTVRIEKEIKALNEAYADPRGLIGLKNYTRQLAELQAQERMAKTLSDPMAGMAGVRQGIGAGAGSVAAGWQGIPAETAQSTIQTLAKMQGAFSNFFTSVAMGTETIGQAFAQLGTDMVGAIVDALAQMLAKWIVTHLMMAIFGKASNATEALTVAGSNFAQAQSAAFLGAANAYAFWAWNPPVAATMAATALTVGESFAASSLASGLAGASMSQGGLLLNDVHGVEAVLPQKLTSYLMDRASRGQQPGGSDNQRVMGDMHFNVNGAADPSATANKIRSVVRSEFTRAIRRAT